MVGSPVFAKSAVWRIDPEKSAVTFVVLRGARVGAEGTFKKVQGNITFDSSNIALSTAIATIPIDTIETGIGARDSDLIGAKYFNSNVFPKATFTSRKIHFGPGGKYVVTGLFTLHGVAKTIDLLLTKPTITTHITGHKLLAASATAVIDQSDYGLSFKLLHPDGVLRINNKIMVKVSIEASADASRK